MWAITRNPATGSRNTFHIAAVGKNKSINCSNKAIRCDDIESRIMTLLVDKIFEESLFDEIAAHYFDYALSRNKDLIRLKALCERSISSLDVKIGNIVSVMAQTGSAALAEQLAAYEKDKEKCTNELTEINLKLAENGVVDIEELHDAFELAKHQLIHGDSENCKLIIDNYIDSIVIYKDRIDVNVNIDRDFRIFRGTLKYNTLIATLQMVNRVCEAAITFNDEEMTSLSWPEFVSAVTEPELIQYLKERRLYVNEPVSETEEF